jgi:hypothetical protein
MWHKETFRPHFFSFAAGLVVALLIAVLTSAASPGLRIGVADNNAFETSDGRGATAARNLGLNMVRIFLFYRPGQTALRPVQKQHIQQVLASGNRVLISMTGKPLRTDAGWTAPAGIETATERSQYVQTLLDLVHTFPAVKDVSIWNEPNYPIFWSNRVAAPERYAELLAASYDALHPLGVRVYGFELNGHRQTTKWISGVGAWMRATHRTQPLFDYFAIHPYPRVNNEAPWIRHRGPNVLGMGDVQRLRALLQNAFAQTAQKRLEIVYTETGWTTAPGANGVTPALQALRMTQALALAYCQRGVHAFLSFLLRDDSNGWQTGFLTSAWATKPVFAAYKEEIARVRAHNVRCSMFPPYAL